MWSLVGGLRFLSTQPCSVPFGPSIPPSHEPFHSRYVGAVVAYVLKPRCRSKSLERQVEVHAPVLVNQVVKQEEFHVSLKALEEPKEGRIPFKDIGEGALGISIESTDALQREVEAIVDRGVATSQLVDRRQTVDLPVGKDEVCTDGRANVKELLQVIRYLLREPLLSVMVPVGVGNGIATQRKLAHV